MNDTRIKDKPCSKDAPVHDFLSTGGAMKARCLEKCPAGYHQDSSIVTKTHVKKVENVRVTYCIPVDEEGKKIPLQLSESARLHRAILRAGQDIVKFGDDNLIDKFPERVKEDVRYLEDIPARGIKKGDLRYQRLKMSIDPSRITTKKSFEQEKERLLQHDNYVACESAAREMIRDKSVDDARIFHSFAWLANIQRKGTLARDVLATCRDVACREVHEKNAREARKTLENARTAAERDVLEKKIDHHDGKVTAITCKLGIGETDGVLFVKNRDELDSCCFKVIREQERRKKTGSRPKPVTVDAIVDRCITLDPKFKDMAGN